MSRDEERDKALKRIIAEDVELLERLANAIEDRKVLRNPDLEISIKQMKAGQGRVVNTECDYPNSECLICGHKNCGWCPDCSPSVPEWD